MAMEKVCFTGALRWVMRTVFMRPQAYTQKQRSALSNQFSVLGSQFSARVFLGGTLENSSWSLVLGSVSVFSGGQLTSRSGVLKPARSRVIIGENARREGGLAEQLQTPAKRLKLQMKAKDLSPRMDADQHGFENARRIRSTSRQ